MSKVLVIRKPDATIHVVPTDNEAILKAQNSKLPADKRWTFELMDEDEAKKLPFIDPDYIKPNEAQRVAKDLLAENEELKKQLAEKGTGTPAAPVVDEEKEALKKELEALKKSSETTQQPDEEKEALKKELEALKKQLAPKPEKAADLILRINKATTEAEVTAIVGEDTRVTVLDAAKERIEEIKLM